MNAAYVVFLGVGDYFRFICVKILKRIDYSMIANRPSSSSLRAKTDFSS